MLPLGKFCDEVAVISVRARTRIRPRQRRDFGPGRLRRPALMAYAISRMDQAGAVMAGHAVEENRLPGGIGEQVGRRSHLFQRRARPAHRNQNPTHSGFGDHLGLFHVLRIIAIDRGQRHDGLDSLAGDDRPQCIRMLPGPSY